MILQDIDRPNIAMLRLDHTSDAERFAVIAEMIRGVREGPGGKSVIFTPTIKKGAVIAEGLRSLDLEVPVFHSKLLPKDRDFLQARFDGRLQPSLDVLISTSAFGMGIDIPNIRLVIHWQHPASIEDYLQEFGRAGRDGKPALAVLFAARRTRSFLRTC